MDSGKLFPINAEKFARIIERPGVLDEQIISWSVDQNGNEIQERVSIVQLNSETNNPVLVVTKVNENGDEIIDNNSHSNQWESAMQIADSGYINITNIDDMYGNSKRDFDDTYRKYHKKNKY